MSETTLLRFIRAIAVIFVIVIFLSLWQIWLALGIAFIIYVYAKDRGQRFPRTYQCITLPFKLLFGNSNEKH